MCGSKAPSAPEAPVLPQVPPMTPEELDAIKQAGVSVDQIGEMISADRINSDETKSILKNLTGLYDENGNLNQEAVNSLRTRVQATATQRANLGSQALDFLGTFFGAPDETTTLATNRLKAALEGTVPVSKGLEQDVAKQFELFKESAGRRGIRIEGDTLDTATSKSTAGIRSIAEFQKRVDVAKESERQGEISTGAQTLGFLNNIRLNNLSFAGGLAGQAGADTSSTLGFLGSLTDYNANSTSNTINQLLGYTGARMSLAQPYAEQRMATYNQATNQATLNYQAQLAAYQQAAAQRSSSLASLGKFGSLAGMAIGGILAAPTGGMSIPIGMALGGAAGGAGATGLGLFV